MRLATANPVSRFAAAHVEWEVPPPPANLQVFEDHSKSILARNDSPDLHFRWSVNPYRGCFHACAYCYARPTHEHLGLGAGSDFDRKLVVKPNAPELLRQALSKPSWQREFILFSGNTDCYQPLEHHYRLTRACLEVCHAFGTPIGVITKSALVCRDAELLAEMGRAAGAEVVLSIPFHHAPTCRAVEPGTPPPARRYEAIRVLSEAGVRVGVNIAPVIPGLSDHDIPAILKAAREAGAQHARVLPVRLSPQVEAVFTERVGATFPGRVASVLGKIRRMRGGELNDARFGERFRGQGEEWASTMALFRTWHDRLGYTERPERAYAPARPPAAPEPTSPQLSLFGALKTGP